MQAYLLLSILIAILTIGGLVLRFRKNLDYSISLNAAKHRYALLWLAGGIGLSLFFASLWYLTWLQSTYALGWQSSMAFSAIIVDLLTAIVVPDIEGRLRLIHRFAAYVAVVAMPLFLLSTYQLFDGPSQIITAAVIAAQLIMIYLLFFVKAALRYLLQFQAVYVVSFFLVALLLTYA